MKRFLKRSFVFIITLILVFSITVPCFASDTPTHGGGGGQYVGLTDEEKFDWWSFRCNYYLARLVGLDEDAAYNFAVDRLLPCVDVKGYSTLEEYFLDHVNYNDETDSFDPDDEMMADINICLEQYNDSVTMTYKYYVSPDNVDYSIFDNKSAMEEFVRVVKKYPDLRFKYIIKCSERWGSNAIWFYVFNDNDFECAVSSNFNLNLSQCDLYSPVWTSPLNYMLIGINDVPDERGVTWCYGPKGNAAGTVTGKTFEDIYENDLAGPISSHSLSTATLSSSKTFGCRLDSYCIISAGNSAINCYKSVTDMKKDASNQVVGGYTPDYTGSCGTSVSVDVMNNFEIPDSGGGSGSGSGSGSDDSGGGSSGGIFDDIISGIASGVGSIIKGIFSIIKDLVDAVADAIVSITKSITDMSSLLRTNFTDFLSAVFPFLPQEFVKIMIAGLTLCLLGIIIKIFRG